MKRKLLFLGLIVFGGLLFAACAGPQGEPGPPGPAGPAGPAGAAGADGAPAMASDLSCTECHNDSAVITGKKNNWSESKHGSGDAVFYAGGRLPCAGCHSGSVFSARIAAGITNPDDLTEVDPNPSRQDCRACHQIHTTYTREDFALETTDPVNFFAVEGATYDGGEGNLCVNCHQPRRDFPEAENGVITGITSHWGPHHGPQSAMLLGVAGAGVEGSPSAHYSVVEDTCVTCHMGEGRVHTYEPNVATCQGCHTDAENFDIEGVQTEVQAMLDELGELLVAEGVLSENSPEGHPTVTEAPENVALALWNWIYVSHEDKSLGVHNVDFTKALLQAGLDALTQE